MLNPCWLERDKSSDCGDKKSYNDKKSGRVGREQHRAVDKMYDVETLPKNKTQFFRLRMSFDKVCSEFLESSMIAANKRTDKD